ncbi:unnamed protein product [Penicillium discolor]
MVTAALVMRSVVQTVLIPATTSWVVMPTTHVHKAVVTNLDSVDLDQTSAKMTVLLAVKEKQNVTRALG